jgi:hypothetical protein
MKTAKTSKNALTRKALAALQSAVAKVVAKGRRDGRPIAVWRNGKAVLVSAGMVGYGTDSRSVVALFPVPTETIRDAVGHGSRGRGQNVSFS